MNIKVDSSVANPDPHHLDGDHDGVVSDPNVTTEIAWDRHLLAVAAEDPPLVTGRPLSGCSARGR